MRRTSLLLLSPLLLPVPAVSNAASMVQVDAVSLSRCLEQISAGTGARFIVSPQLAQDAPRCRPVDAADSAASALDAALVDSDVAWRMRDDGVYLLARNDATPNATLEMLTIEDTAIEDTASVETEAPEGLPRPVASDVASQTRFRREELAAMPLQRFNQIGRLAPNVYSSGQSLSIRGVPRDNDYFTGNSLFVDGIDVGTLLLDHNLLAVDDLAALRYVRGGSTLEHGGGAAGGTIQLDTPLPEPRFGARLAVGGGERSARAASLAATGPLLPDGSLSARLTLSHRDDPRFMRSAVVPGIDGDTDRRENANLRVRWEPESIEGLTIDLSGFHVDAEAPDRGVALPGPNSALGIYDRISFDPSATDYDLRATGRGVRAAYATADGLRLGAWANDLRGAREGLALQEPNRRTFAGDDENRMRTGLSASVPIGAAWRLHASLEQQQIESTESLVAVVAATPTQTVAYTERTRNILDLDNTAAVAELSWKHGPWSAAAGVRHVDESVGFLGRVQFSPQTGTATDRITLRTVSDYRRNLPSASLQYELATSQVLAASYSRGYRSGGFSQFVRIGEYAPERLETTELSWRGAWLDERLGLRASVFRTEWGDRTSIDGTIGAEIIEPFETRIDGAELEFEALLGASISLRGGLGWLDARHRSGRYRFPLGDFDLSGQRAADAPDHTAILGAIWRGEGGWSASIDAYRAGRARSSTFVREALLDPVPLTRAAYTVVDARIGWQREQLGVALTAGNLFDEEYIDRFVARRSYSRILGEPRQVDLTVSWTF